MTEQQITDGWREANIADPHERRAVPGHEGLYEASRDGEIYSLARHVNGRWARGMAIKERKLIPCMGSRGYPIVSLKQVAGVQKSRTVHSLICETFNGPRGPGLQVNHKNGDKGDNRAENLEWVTQSENNRHSFRVLGRKPSKTGAGKFGKLHVRSIPVRATPVGGGAPRQYESIQLAARDGFLAGQISRCINGKISKHRGMIWTKIQQ